MNKYLLRTAVLSCVLCLMSNVSKAQWVAIPDTVFGNLLDIAFPQCMQGSNATGWQMDTTCNAIVTAPKVYWLGPPVKNLSGIEYFDALDTLICIQDSINTIPQFPASLRYIQLSSSFLTHLPPLPAGLTFLQCTNNKLDSLPALPASLTHLECYYNRLTALPVLPASLTYLNCSNNLLTALPALPNALTYLFCGQNNMTALPTLPPSLTYLDCSSNHIAALPALPNSLTTLFCLFNDVTLLPPLPAGLITLDIYLNHLTDLPVTLPVNLSYLDFTFNNVSVLPALPATLTYLSCDGNNLSAIPALPGSLETFYCGGNSQLATIPALPASILYFECSLLPLLTSLPTLPDSLSYLYVEDCPNLTCLPQLKKVKEFYFANTGITCLPNYPESNETSEPALDTVLLCDPFNANACSVHWNIKGNVYNDSVTNCIKDAGETNVHNMKLNLYNNGVVVKQNYCAVYGVYSFDVDTGTYTISVDTTGLPFVLTCPVSGFDTSVITALDSLDNAQDFAMQCKPGFDVGAWAVVSNNSFRPAHITGVEINAGDWARFWGQNCNTSTVSGQLITTITGAATFVSAAPGALTPVVSGNTLTYDILDWSMVNPNTDFNIVVQTDTAAAINSQICFNVNVTPTAGDNNTSNNILSHCFSVVTSYDPNEKEVSPLGNAQSGDWLTYTIHFQNTGNASAEQIYVTDTLDANVDASSFQLLAYSHQPVVQIRDNAVRFNFPNINLPDSNANEAASHGYVQYKVKLKNNLPANTTISNTAFIYFDFNTPVVTNTTTNTTTTATAVADFGLRTSDFRLYPNPASSFVTITVDESMLGSNFVVTDITGRKIMMVTAVNSAFRIPTSALSSGIYFVTLENQNGRTTKKLIIQK